MASQLYLFESETVPGEAGAFVVRPKRLLDGKEITAQKAAGMLGFRDKETIYKLVELGTITGWKPDSARGNGKYRIDLGSVLRYKEGQQAKARGA